MIDPFELYVVDFVNEMNKRFRPKLEKADNKVSLLVLDGIVNFIQDERSSDYVEQRRQESIRDFLKKVSSVTLGEIGIDLGIIKATDSYNIEDLETKIVNEIYKMLYI